MGLQTVPALFFGTQHPKQSLVIPAQQFDVHVVVPRNESSVANRPQQSARTEPIGNIVLHAHTVYVGQHLQHPELMPAQKRSVGVEPRPQLLL